MPNSEHLQHQQDSNFPPPNNSMEPTRPAECLGFGAILVLGWPGGSSRGRWAAYRGPRM